MQIDVLSSAAGRSSGYLLHHGGAAILVDCGPGTAARLTASGWLNRLDAIVITHEHADHAADIIGLAYARRFPDPLPPIPLLAPASALNVLNRLDQLFAVPSLPQMATTIAASFEPEALGMVGVPLTIAAGLQLASYHVAHAVPSAALRFTAERETVTFSSDTGACDALAEAADNADVFLCEATYPRASPDELDGHGHLTPELAATIASRANARHLVLTHLARESDAPAALAAAARHFDPTLVTMASPSLRLNLAGG